MAKRKPKKSQGAIPPPVCKAILLCDAILTDPFSGKTSLVGIFERFVVRQFPGATAPCFAYVQMTNGIGKYRITIEVRNIEHDQNIARANVAEMEFNDRTTKAKVIIM